jgi:hypothetical protein
MPDNIEAVALCARLEAIIKEAKDAEAQAATAHRLGADGYHYPSARAILAFIGIFTSHGPTARPHRLFDLRKHGHRRTSPLGNRSTQRPPAGEHHPRLLRQLR